MGAIDRLAIQGGLLRFVTAGSVDDGKSTLIGRLLHDTQAIFADQWAALERASRKSGIGQVDLSLLTDGLEAEREQGITIDVAYRYFATPRRKFILGDSPGHVQYTRNMVTAASTADVAVLLVDARQGVLPQTRRHAYLARWLGIGQLVLAVNKMDLIEYSQETFDSVHKTFDAFAAPVGFDNITAIPMSALRGDMVVERGANCRWYGGPTLLEYLESAPNLSKRADSHLRFPVQRVARVRGFQPDRAAQMRRGYQGTVAAGSLRVGDPVSILPSGARSWICGIGSSDPNATSAHADEAVTVFLADELDIGRGDMIVAADQPAQALPLLAAELCWLSQEPFDPRRQYLLKHTTRVVRTGPIEISYRIDVDAFRAVAAGADVRMNDIVGANIRLAQPIFADPYVSSRATGSFILIDPASNDTVAAGVIREV